MTTPDSDRIPEDAALVSILSDQIGTLNTLVTRYRLRANAAEERAAAADATIARLEAELVAARANEPALASAVPRVIVPASANEPVGRGEIAVTLDAVPFTHPLEESIIAMDDLDDLLGEVHLR